MSNNIAFSLSPIADAKGFSGRADLSLNGGVLNASFTGENDSHVIRFELPNKVTASGVSAKRHREYTLYALLDMVLKVFLGMRLWLLVW